MLIAAGCKKTTETTDPALKQAVENLSKTYDQAKIAEDSLMMYHNEHNGMMTGMCLYYDSIYHHMDTMFMHYQGQCQQMMGNNSMMNGSGGVNGGMMNGGNNSGGGMMNGGSSSGSGMYCDSSTMNMYNASVNNMVQMRGDHLQFHHKNYIKQ